MIQKPVLKTSRFKMNGVLTIHVREGNQGRVLRTITKRNTITFDAGDVLRALLAQRAADDAAVDLQMGSMRFGTNSTTPTRYDTNLYTEITGVRKQFLDSNKVSGVSGEISFTATMAVGEGNGNTYQEAGLFTRGATWNDPVGGSLMMFSRQIHAAIQKTAAVSLEYTWTIQFTT
jgi:hypothetical protein